MPCAVPHCSLKYITLTSSTACFQRKSGGTVLLRCYYYLITPELPTHCRNDRSWCGRLAFAVPSLVYRVSYVRYHCFCSHGLLPCHCILYITDTDQLLAFEKLCVEVVVSFVRQYFQYPFDREANHSFRVRK